jgi:peptidoglycan/xylan/chitin deacetylase (PgdA/CDA1 family)
MTTASFLSTMTTSRRLARLAAVGLGAALVVVACGGDGRRPDPGAGAPVGTAVTALAEQRYVGDSLGDKELVLTFDDGPGPAEVTGELSTWLAARPMPIRATFFVNGACVAATTLTPNNSCPTPVHGAADILAQLVAEGHTVANHTTTHRNLVAEVPPAELTQEIGETDAVIAPYARWDRLFFRPPFGAWSPEVYATLSTTPMNKYVGPVHWDIGGGPIDDTHAADWACWQNDYTTKQCGDLYLTEVRERGKGIVLMHDPSGDTSNHELESGRGNTVDMVKYVVPILEAEGFTFRSLHEVPAIAAALPGCDATCATCSGPTASDCTTCRAGRWLGDRACKPCSLCPAGTYTSAACAENADTACVPCPAGTSSDKEGATGCTACAPGSYAPERGATSCMPCGDCSDGDSCTTDSCDPKRGCVHEPIPGCTTAPDAPADAGPTPSTPPADDSRGCDAGGRARPSASAVLLGLALVLSRRSVRRARARLTRSTAQDEAYGRARRRLCSA